MRISIAQLMKLVFFVGVACAWAVPALEFRGLVGIGLVEILLFESATIPVLWAMLSFLLVKPGPRKDTIITALVLAAVTVALGIFIGMFIAIVLQTFRRPGHARAMLFEWNVLATLGGVILLLAGSFGFLVGRLIRQVRSSTARK